MSAPFKHGGEKGLSPSKKFSLDPFSSFLPPVCLRNTFPNSSSDKHVLTTLLRRHGKGPPLALQAHTVNGLRQECEAYGTESFERGLPPLHPLHPDQDSPATVPPQSCCIKNQKQRKSEEILPVNGSLEQLEAQLK